MTVECIKWAQHGKTLSTSMEQLWRSAVYTDVSLCVSGLSMRAHRAVLAARSACLRRILLTATQPEDAQHAVIFLRGVSAGTLTLLVQLLYTGCVTSADRRQLAELQELCRELEVDNHLSDILTVSDAGGDAFNTEEICSPHVDSTIIAPSAPPDEGWADTRIEQRVNTVQDAVRAEDEGREAAADSTSALSMLCQPSTSEAYRHMSSWLDQLQYSELRALYLRAQDILYPDYTLWLPDELLVYILSLLTPADLERAARCCRRWCLLALDDSVWRHCWYHRVRRQLQAMVTVVVRNKGASTLDTTHMPISPCSGPVSAGGGDSFLPPTTLGDASEDPTNFKQACQQWIAWTEKPFPPPKVLRGQGSVIRCMAADGARLVTGSSDRTLALWSTDRQRLEHIVNCQSEVTAVQMSAELVVAAARNCTLTVWDLIGGELLHTLTGHEGIVWSVALHDTRAASGSDDKTVRLWDLVAGTCVVVLRQHETVVRAVCFDGTYVVSGDDAGVVQVYNAASEQVEDTWRPASRYIMVLQHAEAVVVSGHGDGCVNVWDMSTRQQLYSVTDPAGWVTDLHVGPRRQLISGYKDGTAVIWDLNTGHRLRLTGEQGHHQRVTAVRLLSPLGLAVTASRDGRVKLWHTRSGRLLRNLVTGELSHGPVKQLHVSPTLLVCCCQNNNTDRPHLLLFDVRWGAQ